MGIETGIEIGDDPTTRFRLSSSRGLVTAVAVGALVAAGLGVFGRVHEPQFFAINVAGFSSPVAVKSWLASLAMALTACVPDAPIRSSAHRGCPISVRRSD